MWLYKEYGKSSWVIDGITFLYGTRWWYIICTKITFWVPLYSGYLRIENTRFVASKPSQNSIWFAAALATLPECDGDRRPPHFVTHFFVSGFCDIVAVMFQILAYNRRMNLGVMLCIRALGIFTSLKGVAQQVAPCSASTLTSSISEVSILTGSVKYCSTFTSFSSPTAGFLPPLLRRGGGCSMGIVPSAKSRNLFHSCSGKGGNILSIAIDQCRCSIPSWRFNGTVRPHIFSLGIFGAKVRITDFAASTGWLDRWLFMRDMNFEAGANLGGLTLGGSRMSCSRDAES